MKITYALAQKGQIHKQQDCFALRIQLGLVRQDHHERVFEIGMACNDRLFAVLLNIIW
jgi:hypothetical protein